MKNIASSGSVIERLKKIMPPGVQPKFTTPQEWRDWQLEEGRKRADEVSRVNDQARAEKILGRSGIQDLHRKCTFANYDVACEGQRRALTMAKRYAQNFGEGFGSFVFSGNPGTGKNHLAAAIGNHLLKTKRTVLIVTIPDLSTLIRATYDGEGGSESALLRDLSRVDLLVLDDVGVQRASKNEWVVLNQIIDRRLSSLRPVGILTNLTHQETGEMLGARIMDRLTMDNGIWVNFDWGSYRQKVSHLHVVK
ncbi:ATP-binding protein [Erwiniaceae bacterium L1_54_6]|nr:ATP-binding protein [Erwiniaceae bacterium L1_54_6]